MTVHVEDGWTALHAAAQEGHLRVVEMLLEAKADVSIKTNVIKEFQPMYLLIRASVYVFYSLR